MKSILNPASFKAKRKEAGHSLHNALLLGLFVCSLPAFALLALSAQAAEPAQASFLRYTPNPSDFDTLLHPAAQLIGEGMQQKKSGQQAAASAKFSSSLKIIASLLQKSNRGYHDELFLLKGFAYEQLSKYEKALEAYQASLKLKANNPLVLFRHAYVLKQLDKQKMAVTEFKEVLWQTDENAHEVLYLIAECLLQTGDKEEALRITQQAYQKDPLFLPVLRQLIKMRRELLEQEPNPIKKSQIEAQIMAELSVVNRQDPNDREGGSALAALLIKRSDPLIHESNLKQAERLSRKFADQSKFKDEQSVRLLFNAQIKQGNIAEAEKTLTQGLSVNTDSKLLIEARKQLEIEKGARQ